MGLTRERGETHEVFSLDLTATVHREGVRDNLIAWFEAEQELFKRKLRERTDC
jgi:hypothetical protein